METDPPSSESQSEPTGPPFFNVAAMTPSQVEWLLLAVEPRPGDRSEGRFDQTAQLLRDIGDFGETDPERALPLYETLVYSEKDACHHVAVFTINRFVVAYYERGYPLEDEIAQLYATAVTRGTDTGDAMAALMKPLIEELPATEVAKLMAKVADIAQGMNFQRRIRKNSDLAYSPQKPPKVRAGGWLARLLRGEGTGSK